jgi:acetyltransferase-like isoleucine patch superfamily enzyme
MEAAMPGWFIDVGRYVGGLLVFALAATFSGLALVPAYLLFQLITAHAGQLWAVASVPLLYGVWGWCLCLCIILYKRLTFYTVREGSFELFSFPIIKWGTTAYLALFANRVFLFLWRGSPYLNWYLRGMGATIGRRVNVNTTEVYDWDLITIDDDVMLGGDSTVLAHLFEGGRMRHAPVHIGKGALVGADATVMPGAVIEEGGVLGASSTLTKNARVPARQIWGGQPARFLRDRAPA